jgi:hypothetical protein
MTFLKHKKNHARKLLSLIVATAMLTAVFAVTSYSGTRSVSSGAAKTNAATVSRTQPQTPALKYNGKIAFTSDRDGNREIYLMNPDGTNQTKLTNNSIVDDHAMWSPDGQKLAFVSQRAAGGLPLLEVWAPICALVSKGQDNRTRQGRASPDRSETRPRVGG